MSVSVVLVVTQLLTLHRIDGREIHIIPNQVTVVVVPKADNDPRKLVHPDGNCLVYLTDGHFYPVLEECGDVKKALEAYR